TKSPFEGHGYRLKFRRGGTCKRYCTAGDCIHDDPALESTTEGGYLHSQSKAMDQLNAGIIITDSCAEVVEINRSAESIVHLEDGLLIRNDRLCAKRAFETGKILKLIAAATAECEWAASTGRMLIGRCDGLPAYVLSTASLRI